MILLLDAGNTRIKWAYLEQGLLRPGGAWPTREVAGLCGAWAGTGSGDGPPSRPSLPDAEVPPRPEPLPRSIERVVAACVAGVAVRTALEACLQALGFVVDWVEPQGAGHGLVNRYRPPESLGVDRYCALVGAARRCRRDCVVVSVGTAMTADMLTADGTFLGGCIVPWPELMRSALSTGTAGVGLRAGGWQDFPRDTGAAVETGVVLALAGVVVGMRGRLADLGNPGASTDLPAVVLTGGGRDWLAGRLQGEVLEVDELVLEGLAWIARDLACAV